MKYFMIILGLGITLAGAADLVINGQSGKTYSGQSYGKCTITNSNTITIRNCNFSSAASKVISIDGSSHHITFENCDINGQNETCQAVQSSGSSLTFQNCELHDIADDGFSMHGGSNLKFIGCSVHDLIGKGTDAIIPGPCYNGHSDGWELANIHGCEMIGNIAYNIKSTSALHMGNWDGAKDNRNFYLANNLFYTPDVGFCIYVHYISGIELYHNTFWKGSNGGLALGWGVTGLKARNNIISIINTQHSGVTLNPTNHDFDWNLVGLASGGVPLQPHDTFAPNVLFKRIPAVIGGDIIQDVKPEDFELQAGSPAINKGTTDAAFPATDFYGNPRVGAPDLGGIEYQGTGLSGRLPGDKPPLLGMEISPNPFTDHTAIRFCPAGVQPLWVRIVNVTGRTVMSADIHQAGASVHWDGRDMTTGKRCTEGQYLVQIHYPGRTETRQLMLMGR